MLRRRGGTNKLKQPKKDKNDGKQKKNASEIIISSDNLCQGSAPISFPGAGTSANINICAADGRSMIINREIPGPSTAAHSQPESSCDFVFKRPKTPPPKPSQRKGSQSFGGCLPESRRIRSKLKPGKTGFPIGVSLHGLSRSEKLERRSKGKSRSHSNSYSEGDHSLFKNSERIFESQMEASSLEMNRGIGRISAEQVISYPRQTVTKLKFPPPRQRSSSEQAGSKKQDNIQDQRGVKETLEICQGFSKVKIDDWYPLFDFHHSKRNVSHAESSASSSDNSARENNVRGEEDDEDEWEETLVYVDLEDIPDVDSLFSTLTARKSNLDSSTNGTENSNNDSVSSDLEIKIFNLDSELPVLRVGNKYLAGHWEEPLGTSLFFKKKTDGSTETTESTVTPASKLKSLVPEPEIPYDPIFGKNYDSQSDGYELVAKSVKILKARHFPVVTEEQKGEDVIRDADDEFDHRDFQIPPVNMVRQFMSKDACSYEKYLENDIERRRLIREKWGSKTELEEEGDDANHVVKTEPVDHEDECISDDDDIDSILFLDNQQSEPTPGPSKR